MALANHALFSLSMRPLSERIYVEFWRGLGRGGKQEKSSKSLMVIAIVYSLFKLHNMLIWGDRATRVRKESIVVQCGLGKQNICLLPLNYDRAWIDLGAHLPNES